MTNENETRFPSSEEELELFQPERAITAQDVLRAVFQPGDTVWCRVFDDTKKTDFRGMKFDVPRDKFSTLEPILRGHNAQRRGVYFVVNTGGNEDAEITRINAQFMEMDEGTMDKQLRLISEFPLVPSMVIRTKKSLHTYWFVDGAEVGRFRVIQSRLADHFGGDQHVKNESRVMRLPGFNHCKAEPVLVRCVWFHPELRYTQDALEAAMDEDANPSGAESSAPSAPVVKTEPAEGPQNPSSAGSTFWTRERMLDTLPSILEAINPDCEEPVWWEVAAILKIEGMPFSYFDQWSSWGSKYDGAEATRRKWDSIKNDTMNPARWPSLVKMALERGWKDPLVESVLPHEGDFTDAGVADQFVKRYRDTVKYCPSLGWLAWNGKVWEAGDHLGLRAGWKLSSEMLEAAQRLVKESSLMAWDGQPSEEAKKFAQFAAKRNRSHTGIREAISLAAVREEVLVTQEELDPEPEAINTPAGLVELSTGNMRPTRPEDLCSHITGCAPSSTEEGSKKWQDFLRLITCDDESLQQYLQVVIGSQLLGRVKKEHLFIAYGGGRNGKSTFYNALSKVLGDYAGTIDTEILTLDPGHGNRQFEMAALRGKRFVTAGELEEGTRLSSAFVKKIASTDTFRAGKKYKDAEDIRPTHHTNLFSNYLPKVGSTDKGTWRRLVVIPFEATMPEGQKEIADYAEVLFSQAGGDMLTWAIEGAVLFIQAGYKFPKCSRVEEATQAWRQREDWLQQFVTECCVTGPECEVISTELWREYDAYTISTKTYKRGRGDFNIAMENAGFVQRGAGGHKTVWKGLRLKDQFERDEDPTSGGWRGDITR